MSILIDTKILEAVGEHLEQQTPDKKFSAIPNSAYAPVKIYNIDSDKGLQLLICAGLVLFFLMLSSLSGLPLFIFVLPLVASCFLATHLINIWLTPSDKALENIHQRVSDSLKLWAKARYGISLPNENSQLDMLATWLMKEPSNPQEVKTLSIELPEHEAKVEYYRGVMTIYTQPSQLNQLDQEISYAETNLYRLKEKQAKLQNGRQEYKTFKDDIPYL